MHWWCIAREGRLLWSTLKATGVFICVVPDLEDCAKNVDRQQRHAVHNRKDSSASRNIERRCLHLQVISEVLKTSDVAL